MNATVLRSGLLSALARLMAQGEAALVEAIQPIVLTNLARQRVHNFLSGGSHHTPAAYVARVAEMYRCYQPLLHRLQVEKCHGAWEYLVGRLREWVFAYLDLNRLPVVEQEAQIQACVSEATTVFLEAHFPYDVEFEPWACIVLRNVCRQQEDRRRYALSVPEWSLVEAEQWEGWLESLPDKAGYQARQQQELRRDLLWAMDRLASDARREFLHLYYFEQQSFTQIAAHMNRSASSLYKLHFDALKDLRQIWLNQ